MIQFNEAVDQALVEAVTAYGIAAEKTRKTVLGVLGHDLRTPLGAVTLGADLLRQSEELGSHGKRLISQISLSAQNANQMVNDLLDLARCNLGTGIPVRPENADLASICKSVVDELSIAHPNAKILFDKPGPLKGHYDPQRIAQAFSNLIGNAVRHGDSQQPINVSLGVESTSTFLACKIMANRFPPVCYPRFSIRRVAIPDIPIMIKEYLQGSAWAVHRGSDCRRPWRNHRGRINVGQRNAFPRRIAPWLTNNVQNYARR